MRNWLPAHRCLLAAGLIGLAGAPAAQAQMQSREAIALQNQILELRHDLQMLSDQVANAPASSPRVVRERPQPNDAPNDLAASLLERVSRLEDEVRALRGRVDELGHTVQRQGDDLTKQIGDLNFRVQNTESTPPPAPPPPGQSRPAPPQPSYGQSSPPPVTPTPGAQPPRASEVALQQGNAALARRDYAAAEAAAREVLAHGGPRSYDAQLLLAEALMGKKDYQQAALAYDDTYNKSRAGIHAQEALLGLANSLMGINEKRAACDTLAKLHAEFPQPRAGITESATALRQRAGCG